MSNSPQELKETEELDIQLKVFNENKEEDSIELSHRLDDIRAEMEYPFVFPLCEYTVEQACLTSSETRVYIVGLVKLCGVKPLMAWFIREGLEEPEHIPGNTR